MSGASQVTNSVPPVRNEQAPVVKSTLGLLPLIALSAALTGPAAAQDGGDIALDQVNVQGGGGTGGNTNNAQPALTRVPTAVLDTPQVINVITAEELQQRGVTSLNEIITRVPGVTMSAGEGGGGGQSGDSFNIRGQSAVGNIFQDGARDSGVYHRDAFNLEQVEVHKGSTGTTLGRGGGGGSINLQSKRARDHFFADVLGTVGYPGYYRGSFDVNLPITPDIAARLNGFGIYKDYAGRDFANLTRFGVAPTITFGMQSDTKFTLSYLYQQDRGRPDNGVPRFAAPGDVVLRPVTELGVNPSNYYGYEEDYEAYRTHIATAIFEHSFTPDIKFTNVTRFGSYDTERHVSTMPPGNIYNAATCPTIDNCTIAPGYSTRGMRGQTYQNQATLTWDFNTGPLSHEAVIGLDVSRENLHHLNYAFAGPAMARLDLNNPVLLPHNRTKTLSGDINHTVDTIGANIYDRIHFGKGFYGIGGVRVERYSVNSLNEFNGQSAGFGQTLFSWQAALEYKPFESHTYYLAVSNTQLPTSPTTGYAGLPNTYASDPHEVRNYEIGGKWNVLDQRLGLGASVFYQNRSNSTDTDANGNLVVNTDTRNVYGVELSVQGQITEKISISAGYAYLRGRISNPGEANDGFAIGLMPEHSGYVWGDYKFNEKFSVGAGLNFTSFRYTADYDPATGAGGRLPGHVTFDMSANWQVHKNFGLQLNANNIFNAQTFEKSHGARHMVPGEGRRIMLTGKATF